mmetsp:Transcript_17829/g.30242  ORF Transcript_17829/g.30242 Transcript_17829/m.30242 type:complete len:105 (-) Transcript_17829:94-408(-)
MDVRSAESAYKRGNGRRVDGKNVLVDKELARIDKYWLPRRLGGGKGGDSRRNPEEESMIKQIRKEIRERQKAQQAQVKKEEPELKDNKHSAGYKVQKSESEPQQ